MNGFALLSTIYTAFARVATNTGVDAIDLCLVRTSGTLLTAIITIIINRKHVINEIPKKFRLLVFVRCILGLIAFTCLLLGCKYLPIFEVGIIFNMSPFVIAILAYLINREPVNRFT